MSRSNTARRASLSGIATILALLLALLAGCGPSKSTDTSQAPISTTPAAGSASTKAATASWLAVTLTDGSAFFGVPRSDAPDGILFLDDTYFLAKRGDVAGANTLRRFGNEIHKPYSAIAIPLTSVLYEQPLVGGSAVVKAIATFEAKQAYKSAPSIDASSTKPYAVFLRDSQVIFGPIAFTPKDSLTVRNAYYLTFKNQKAAKLGEIKSINDVTLVPEQSIAIGPSGDVVAPLTSVMYFQPLTDGSPVAKAISK